VIRIRIRPCHFPYPELFLRNNLKEKIRTISPNSLRFRNSVFPCMMWEPWVRLTKVDNFSNGVLPVVRYKKRFDSRTLSLRRQEDENGRVWPPFLKPGWNRLGNHPFRMRDPTPVLQPPRRKNARKISFTTKFMVHLVFKYAQAIWLGSRVAEIKNDLNFIS
jgi:hypothetical protein